MTLQQYGSSTATYNRRPDDLTTNDNKRRTQQYPGVVDLYIVDLYYYFQRAWNTENDIVVKYIYYRYAYKKCRFVSTKN